VGKAVVICVKFLCDVACQKLLKSTNVSRSYSNNNTGTVFFLRHGVQGEPKKCPNTNIMISQKCVDIFVPNFAHLFTRQLCKCAALCCIYLTYAKLTECKLQERILQLHRRLTLSK